MQTFGRYTLHALIGRGGMAEVWRAKSVGPGGFTKSCAIKLLLSDLADDRTCAAMFVEEARLAAELQHPNLVQVFDFGEQDGRPFLAMEFVSGCNLAHLHRGLERRGRRLSAEGATYVAIEAARGLAYAHAHGVVHRDVSPDNVLLSRDGGVKVGDFGIAKLASSTPRTGVGQVRGKIPYMSPEQLSGGALDGRSDLFSLAAVLYELLDGRRLLRGPDARALAAQLYAFVPGDLELAAVPAGLRPVLLRALEPARDARFASATDVELALAATLDGGALARARLEVGAAVRLVAGADPRFGDSETLLALDAKGHGVDGPTEPLAVGGARASARVDEPPATALESPVARPASKPRLDVDASEPPTTTVTTPSRPRDGERAEPAHGAAAAPRRAPGPDASGATPPSSRRTTARRWLAAGVAGLLAALGLVLALRGFRAAHPGAGAPRRGGVLRFAIQAPVGSFDVFSFESVRSRIALDQVIEPLLMAGADGELAPWVLDPPVLSPDARTLSLRVRDEVWFHDHHCLPGGRGRVATGEDLAYSLRAALDHRVVALPIEALVVEGQAVTLRLAAPSPFYQPELARVRLLPRELEGCEDLGRLAQPVGTGPFRFASAPAGMHIDLVRAPHYWRRGEDGERLPYLDGLELQSGDDLRSMVGRLIDGSLDAAQPSRMDVREGVAVVAGRPVLTSVPRDLPVRVTMDSVRDISSTLLLLVGRRSGPMQDLRVRRALALALDRPALLAAATVRILGPADRFLSSTLLGFDPTLRGFTRDLTAARALVAEARPGPLVIGVGSMRPVAARLVAQAAEVGLEVQVVDVPNGQVGSMLAGLDAFLGVSSWRTYGDEPAELLPSLVKADVPADVRELHARLIQTADREGRRALYRQLEAAMLDQVLAIPLGWVDATEYAAVRLLHARVRGAVEEQTGSNWKGFDAAWLER